MLCFRVAPISMNNLLLFNAVFQFLYCLVSILIRTIVANAKLVTKKNTF